MKMYKFSFMIALACIAACQNDRSAEINAEILRRVQRSEKQYRLDCTQRMFQEAEQIADSLLLAEAKLSLNDSMRNRAPYKPLPPAVLSPIDSLEVKPLFNR
jgi:hypothetical protein